MKYYFLYKKDTDNDNDWEVHNEFCDLKFISYLKVNLGYFNDCHEAVKAAKERYPYRNINGCFHCCSPCHIG